MTKHPLDGLPDDIRAHIESETEDNIARGMTPEAARFAALRTFGNVTMAAESTRRVWIPAWLDQLSQDLRYGLRGLRRNPGFTTTVILTLALGIGANTAIFTVVNAVLLRPLPYIDPDRLVQVIQYMPAGTAGNDSPVRATAISMDAFAAIRDGSRTLADAAGSVFASATLLTAHDAVRLEGSQVSASAFRLLGVAALIGRPFAAQEEVSDADAVVVLSYDTWRRHLASDPGVIGRVVRMDGRDRTVLGVMPAGFAFPDPHAKFWIPYAPPAANSRRFVSPKVVAGLREGVSIRQAQAEIDALFDQKPNMPRRYELVGLHDEQVASVRPALRMIAVAVGFVLLIAAVNVANLLLARSAARQREMAVRMAIGASSGRLLRQTLTEGTLLALCGGIAGLAIAAAGVDLLQWLGTSLARRDLGTGATIPRLDEIRIDGIALAFTLAVSLGTGIAFGLAPALGRFQGSPLHSLQILAPATRARQLLVVAEIALAVVLLVGGGLVLRSFLKLSSVDPGYNPSNVLTMQVSTSRPPTQMKPFADDVVQRLSALPGVSASAYGNNIPLVQQGFSRAVSPRPLGPGERAQPPFPGMHLVSAQFVETFGLRIVDGRGFGSEPSREALVNRTLARSGFLGETSIGQRIYSSNDRWWEVVGILDDVRQWGLDRAPSPAIYIVDYVGPPPGLGGSYFAVRSEQDPGALAQAVRGVVRQLDPEATIDNVAMMTQMMSSSIARPRMYTALLGIFAACAAALAAIGVYGVMAFSVSQRTREIGIRTAIGAAQADILRLVLREGLLLTVVGLGLGLAGAAVLTRYFESLLFGVSPLDPLAFVGAAGLFAAVATLAACIPARRATRVNPIVALRVE